MPKRSRITTPSASNSITTPLTITTKTTTTNNNNSNNEYDDDRERISSSSTTNVNLFSLFLLSPPSPPSSSSSSSSPSSSSPPNNKDASDYISAVGLCGVNGYEAEVNHIIGLCHSARTDHHLLLTVAKCRGTHTYKKRRKNRLMYACLTGNLPWFRTLFRMTGKTDIEGVRTRRKETLYHLACTLSNRKYNNVKTSTYEHPYQIPERLQILNTLLTTQIDVNVKANITKKLTAFDIAADDCNRLLPRDDRQQLIRWWLEHLDRSNAKNLNRCLPWLAYFNRFDDVQRLCRMENMNLNILTNGGRSALTLAAYEGHTSIVNVLLSYYPHRVTKLNHQDCFGLTPLLSACDNNRLDIVQILFRYPEVDLNLVDEDGRTALIVATDEGRTSVVKELLSYYPHRLTTININLPGKAISTVLHWACQYNHFDIVQQLFQLPEVDLNQVDEKGRTALVIAAELLHVPIINELLTYYPHRSKSPK